MDVNFHCQDPLNTVSRAMDIARRMSVDFDRMNMHREKSGLFEVNVALKTDDPTLCERFILRLHQCHDLIKEKRDV